MKIQNSIDVAILARWSSGKETVCNAGDAAEAEGLTSEPGRSPGVGNGNSLQYFLPGKFHG